MLAQAYMSLALILAQFPVGGDQMHPDAPMATPVADETWWDRLEVIFVLFSPIIIGFFVSLIFKVFEKKGKDADERPKMSKAWRDSFGSD